ncbi:hypothetical protein QQ054_01100 [Oscillatoria amoena NRMC-F 0135]|nr:hypothetical protein [Oscillatoria amoena NRMC-F 0135]
MQFKVHLFNTEAHAVAAMDALDAILGYPRQDAEHYAVYHTHNDKFYIIADDVTESVLLTQSVTISIPE